MTAVGLTEAAPADCRRAAAGSAGRAGACPPNPVTVVAIRGITAFARTLAATRLDAESPAGRAERVALAARDVVGPEFWFWELDASASRGAASACPAEPIAMAVPMPSIAAKGPRRPMKAAALMALPTLSCDCITTVHWVLDSLPNSAYW